MTRGPELIGGVEHRVIQVVDYDPAWPVRFQAERGRIEAALGSRARRVAHIGSTSVPGLAAKPIVDIQVSVPDLEDEPGYVAPLEAAGYRLRVWAAEHRMVRTPDLAVHVHICPVDR
ncbi:GrpB family protein [Protofrankia sp. BMG5.30]|uniref:GrpB family protein n=1 Tax=Protofrankia sp. BMG5.30 TaxID=1834514 RepID=UPI000AC8152F|nr:GrpB family protein [Protofrankia sp. BMG5.30]